MALCKEWISKRRASGGFGMAADLDVFSRFCEDLDPFYEELVDLMVQR